MDDAMTPERLRGIQARCDKATPGSWTTNGKPDYSEVWDGHSWGKALSPLAMVGSSVDDANFIAGARTDIPDLLAEVARLTAQLADVTRERDAAKKCIYDTETYIELGSKGYALKTIATWRRPVAENTQPMDAPGDEPGKGDKHL